MTVKLLFAVLAVCAGIASTLQSAANAGLAQRTGLPAALVVNTSIVLLATLVFLMAARGSQPVFFPPGTPWSLYVGGLCGFVIIVILAFVFPRIGAALAIALMVLGQSVAALTIDHYGFLGMPRDPVTASRVAGLALVAAGIALLRH